MKKSDDSIVAMNAPNKGDDTLAEQRERRLSPEGKPRDPTTHQAQKWARVSQGKERLREFMKRNPEERLTTLLHHVSMEALRTYPSGEVHYNRGYLLSQLE